MSERLTRAAVSSAHRGGRKLKRSADQRQPETIVSSVLHDRVERCSRFLGQRFESRIVFHFLDWLLVLAERDLDSGIENPFRVERRFDLRKRLDRVLMPDAREKGSANSPIAVLSRKGATKSGG